MKTVRSCLQHLFHVYSSMSYLFSMGWLNFQNSFKLCGVGTEHKFFRKIFSYVLRITYYVLAVEMPTSRNVNISNTMELTS